MCAFVHGSVRLYACMHFLPVRMYRFEFACFCCRSLLLVFAKILQKTNIETKNACNGILSLCHIINAKKLKKVLKYCLLLAFQVFMYYNCQLFVFCSNRFVLFFIFCCSPVRCSAVLFYFFVAVVIGSFVAS